LPGRRDRGGAALISAPLGPEALGSGEVHVWSAELDDPDWASWPSLSPDERLRAERLRRRSDRRRWAASRRLLRTVLARYLADSDPTAIRLRVDERGKPRLCDEPGIRFNLSHSGPFALVAVAAGREVGVDVEVISGDRDVVRLAEVALSRAEASAVRDAGPDRVPAFYEAWVRKEAVAKCLGVGLGAALPPDPVFVQALEVGPGMKAALAVAGAEPVEVAPRSASAPSFAAVRPRLRVRGGKPPPP